MAIEETPLSPLEEAHHAILNGDVGGFLIASALLSYDSSDEDLNAYVERATAYMMAQAQAEDQPSPFRAAVLAGHAALYDDAYAVASEASVAGSDRPIDTL